MSFGEIIVEARLRAGMSQKELASKLRKEDGTPISAQYLHDIERGRRNPPSGVLLTQMAEVLGLPDDYLHFAAGELPDDLRRGSFRPDQVQRAFGALRQELGRSNDT
jgi:transcriptional regulator with XRE-family HTH domain